MTSSAVPNRNLSPDDRTRIEHMIQAAESALRFVSGRSRADLDDDECCRLPLSERSRLSAKQRAGLVSPDASPTAEIIPWQLIISMRNRVVHAYFDIEPDIVWKTVLDELPDLLPKLRGLLATD